MLTILFHLYILNGIYSKYKNSCREILKQVVLLLTVTVIIVLIGTQDFHFQRKEIQI